MNTLNLVTKLLIQDEITRSPDKAREYLAYLVNLQTNRELVTLHTVERNFVGLSSSDAKTLTLIHTSTVGQPDISPDLHQVLIKRLPKYWRQLQNKE